MEGELHGSSTPLRADPSGEPVKVNVKPGACQGHMMCATHMPEMFDADDDGFVIVLHEGQVPEGSESVARHAVQVCPEKALVVEA